MGLVPRRGHDLGTERAQSGLMSKSGAVEFAETAWPKTKNPLKIIGFWRPDGLNRVVGDAGFEPATPAV